MHWQALGCAFLVTRCNIIRASWKFKMERLSYRKKYIEESVWGTSLTSNKVGCQVVAVLLHYFLLTTFFWMGVEAVNIYQMFVKVFRKGSERRFLLRSTLVAWGKWLLFFLSSSQSPVCSIRAVHFKASKTFLEGD